MVIVIMMSGVERKGRNRQMAGKVEVEALQREGKGERGRGIKLGSGWETWA